MDSRAVYTAVEFPILILVALTEGTSLSFLQKIWYKTPVPTHPSNRAQQYRDQSQVEPLGQGLGQLQGTSPEVSTIHIHESASLNSENHYPSVF